MLSFTNPAFSAYRPAFVVAFPLDTPAHRAAQKALFGAARAAGLPTTEPYRENMLAGINQLLGLRLESRRQMTVQEMEAVTVAIQAGAFLPRWRVMAGFEARVQITVTVHLSPVAANALAPDTDDAEFWAGYENHFYQV